MQNDVLLGIAKDLATNTEATKNIEKHLGTLNSKVALQESTTQSVRTIVDLHTDMLARMEKENEDRSKRRSKLAWLTIENIFKLVFGVAIVYLLFLAGLN